MLIVNADDWGRSAEETDAALSCYVKGRISSATAMVFMGDSERAAKVGVEVGIPLGLHLNLDEPFTANVASMALRRAHDRVARFLKKGRYALLVYNPCLKSAFRDAYKGQAEEFVRLYGKAPSHVDGHHHRHLCANMVLGGIIPRGKKVRRNFSFGPGEKSLFNRAYRSLIDRSLKRRYRLTDFFFCISKCLEGQRLREVMHLAETSAVELMTHPLRENERAFLMSNDYGASLEGVKLASYEAL